MPHRKQDPADIIEQIRTNWAFEHMIVAVLTGAGVGGALTFLTALGGALLSHAGLGPALGPAFVKAVLVAFLVFLIGFLSGVVIVAPLFRAMERARRRSVWPYAVALLAIAAVALALASNLSGPAGVGPGVVMAVVASSVVIAVLFARRMRPLWRAAEKAEAEAADDLKMLH